jgi:L-fuculose-phosphate aldolase
MTQPNDLAHAFDILAAGSQILSVEGHDDNTLGHMSMRDASGRGFWIKRAGIALGEVTSSDFVLFDLDGNKLEGEGDRQLEWPIHAEIYRARPDVGAVGHTHPFYATIFSAVEADLPMVTHDSCRFGGSVPRFRELTGLIKTPSQGHALALSLGSAHAVLQQNHGVTFVGGTVEQATLYGLAIEKACHQMMVLKASGFTTTEPQGAERAERSAPIPQRLALEFFGYHRRRLGGKTT